MPCWQSQQVIKERERGEGGNKRTQYNRRSVTAVVGFGKMGPNSMSMGIFAINTVETKPGYKQSPVIFTCARWLYLDTLCTIESAVLVLLSLIVMFLVK